jgi:hypothetical protein
LLASLVLCVCVACEQRAPAKAPRPASEAFALSRDTGSDTQAATAREVGSIQPTDESYERFAGSTFGLEQIERTLATSSFRELRPVGTTSVVFRASLDAPFRAALKLATFARPVGPASEVAAFRLSRCLGLTTVPPAVLRRLTASSIELALDPRFAERASQLMTRAALDPQQHVEAAAIFWIEGMRELPIATHQERQPVLQALLQGSLVTGDVQLMAAQFSDLAVFDLLLGNADRWSGGNTQGDATGQWLYIRDHDLAFPAHVTAEVEYRLSAQLMQVERFSRSLILRLRTLTPELLQQEWSKDPELSRRSNWLRDRVLPGVLERRQKVLAHVQSLIDRYGENAVLSFP